MGCVCSFATPANNDTLVNMKNEKYEPNGGFYHSEGENEMECKSAFRNKQTSAQVTFSFSDPLYSFVLCGVVKVKHRQQV